MKKNLTIIALLLIVSLAFFSCDTREFSGYPMGSLDPLVIDDPAEIGAMLSALNYYNQTGEPVGMSTLGNKATVDILATDEENTSDVHGFLITFPTVSLYSEVEISFRLDSATTIAEGKQAKIGFKKNGPVGDLLPHSAHELHFPTVGSTATQTVALSAVGGSIIFGNNQYGNGSPKPVNYTLEITNITFNP